MLKKCKIPITCTRLRIENKNLKNVQVFFYFVELEFKKIFNKKKIQRAFVFIKNQIGLVFNLFIICILKLQQKKRKNKKLFA